MKSCIKTGLITASLLFASDAFAVICLANNVRSTTQELYLANNCQYFSGSKELRLNRSGALFNYNNSGDYQDQISGNSFIYCPILGDTKANTHMSAEIKVSDLNQQQDVVCQMGKSSYTKNGFAAYWGETARSKQVGEQTITTASQMSKHASAMPNSFITCSLPPQNNGDQKASSLVAYTVSKQGGPSSGVLSSK